MRIENCIGMPHQRYLHCGTFIKEWFYIDNLKWAYMIAGSARINAVDQNGKAFAANIVCQGL